VEVIVADDFSYDIKNRRVRGDLKNFTGSATASASKKNVFSDDDELRGYANLYANMGTEVKDKIGVGGLGVNYRKNLTPESYFEIYGDKPMGGPASGGIRYTRQGNIFKKGGAVKKSKAKKSASARADGIAKKGKTRGRIV
jgi:hypothetical protein